MLLSQRLREIRKIKKMTIADVAQASGVSSATISQIENGNSVPSAEFVLKLSEALDCSTDYLLKDIQEEDSVKERGVAYSVDNSKDDKEIINTLVMLVNETINSKNETITIQKEYKNEVTSLYQNFNQSILQEKDSQIRIYKEVLERYNKT